MRRYHERSAAAHVFALPELCSAIFEHLETKTIYGVVRVCHTWAAHGLKLLWRDVPAAALQVQPCFGNYDYHSFIRRLSMNEADADDRKLRQWTFPRLRHLSMEPLYVKRNPSQAAWLLDCCGPALGSFTIVCNPLDLGFYDGLDFQVISALARHTSLLDVRIDIGISSDDDRNAITGALSSPGAFRCVQSFTAAMCPWILPCLVSTLASVATLDLRVVDGADGVLAVVSRVYRLRHLSLTFAQTVTLAADELLELRSLTQLRSLHMYADYDVTYDYFCVINAPSFGDGECAALVAKLPELREWSVRSRLGLSPAGFAVFGTHCRKLERLTVRAESDLAVLRAVATPAPLFPAMQYLELAELVIAG
jgi:hypothetical protein